MVPFNIKYKMASSKRHQVKIMAMPCDINIVIVKHLFNHDGIYSIAELVVHIRLTIISCFS